MNKTSIIACAIALTLTAATQAGETQTVIIKKQLVDTGGAEIAGDDSESANQHKLQYNDTIVFYTPPKGWTVKSTSAEASNYDDDAPQLGGEVTFTIKIEKVKKQKRKKTNDRNA